ncbi:MAG: macro domain-containing protein [Nanobdellota archaeon]
MNDYNITFADLDLEIINQYSRILSKFKNMKFIQNDITNVEGDAIVSPANSSGLMDGGVDEEIVGRFGESLQERVELMIDNDFGGNMPIGEARVVPTYDKKIPYIIVAPTMERPSKEISNEQVFNAAYAIFNCVDLHNKNNKELKSIENLLIPGLGTGYGNISPLNSAYSIGQAYKKYSEEK